MIKAVRSKVYDVISPILPRREERTENVKNKRKRRCEEDHLAVPMNTSPSKKKKTNESNESSSSLFSMKHWSLSSLMSYIVGGTKYEDSAKDFKKVESLSKDSNSIGRTKNRKNIEKSSTSKRTRLKQISHAKVLDLTQDEHDDDDTDNNDDDLKCTKVVVDLSKQTAKEQTLNETLHLVESPFTKVKPITKSIERRSSPNNIIEKNIRLEERKRYQEILAHFTSVSLPEYSNSINFPGHTSNVHTTSHDVSVDSISTSPIFQLNSNGKLPTPSIDLTKNDDTFARRKKDVIDVDKILAKRDEIGRYNQRSSSPRILPSWQRHQFSTMPYLDISNENDEMESKYITQGNINKNKGTKYQSALLDSNWIEKWRTRIDPLELERDRLITIEERKAEILRKKKQEEFERLKEKLEKDKSKEFVKLSEDTLKLIKRVLGPGNPNEVFSSGFNADIRRSDLLTLRDSVWLNDEVVNFYFNLLKERSEKNNNLPKVFVFNTFFYPKIMKMGHAGVKRWTRKVNIFEMDLILIPVHLGVHWCLAVIDFKNKNLEYYDSMKGNNMKCLTALENYLQAESKDKLKKDCDLSDWDLLIPKNIPEQQNGCDCGVFMCKYAEYKSRYASFTFTQENMKYFRKRMIYEIVSKNLM